MLNIKVVCANLLVGCLLGFVSCKKSSEKPVQIKDMQTVSKEGDSLSSKSMKDTNFIDSKEYQMDKQQLDITLSKQTSSMNNNDRMLVFFETYLRMLKQYSAKVVKEPSLAKNKKYMEETQYWASKVRDYHEALTKAELTGQQKMRFELLNKSFKSL